MLNLSVIKIIVIIMHINFIIRSKLLSFCGPQCMHGCTLEASCIIHVSACTVPCCFVF